MDEDEVLAILKAHLQVWLEPDYPTIFITESVEKGMAALKGTKNNPLEDAQARPFVALTIRNRNFTRFPGSPETEWEFLANMASVERRYGETRPDAAQKADIQLTKRVGRAFDLKANYVALRDAGLYGAECNPLSDNELGAGMINPHVISVKTYRRGG